MPFWIARHALDLLPIGWVCLEYAVIGFLGIFLPGFLTGALLFIVIGLDIVGSISKTYFLTPSECLHNIRLLSQASHDRLLQMCALLLVVILFSVVAGYLSSNVTRSQAKAISITLLAFIGMGLIADYGFISSEAGHLANPLIGSRPSDQDRFSSYSSLWIGRYPALRLLRDQRIFAYRAQAISASGWNGRPVSSATAKALALIRPDVISDKSQLPNIVLVLVESWGLETDSGIRDALTASYIQPTLLTKYRILQGEVPFDGATVAGETRELCSNGMGLLVVRATESMLKRCLPDVLHSIGYESVALHGMDGRMFDRLSWYRTIGFQEEWFRDRFRHMGLPACVGAYDGICDAAIGNWIGRRLQAGGATPEFIYWVSLNSHLPVPPPSSEDASLSCSQSPLLQKSSALCSWFQFVKLVHQSISEIAIGKLDRPTVFIVVGDHAPPFGNGQIRSQFSGKNVPYIILLPRKGGL